MIADMFSLISSTHDAPSITFRNSLYIWNSYVLQLQLTAENSFSSHDFSGQEFNCSDSLLNAFYLFRKFSGTDERHCGEALASFEAQL